MHNLFHSRAQQQEAWLVPEFVGFVSVLLIWTLVAELGLVHPQFLPSPVAVVEALHQNSSPKRASSGMWASALPASGSRCWHRRPSPFHSTCRSSSYRGIGAFFEPLIDFIRYLPVPALVPLTLIWLGIGEISKVALLWIGTFFQLVLLVADDARRVRRMRSNGTARSVRATRR